MINQWEGVQVGHIIVGNAGDKAKILAVIGNLIARSAWYSFESFAEWITIEDCIKRGFLLKKGTKIVMTKQEIEALLGSDLEIINN